MPSLLLPKLPRLSKASYASQDENRRRILWAPAINNHGDFERRAFVEITDPWDAKNTIRATIGAMEGLV